MIWPVDTPPWLRSAVEDMQDTANRLLVQEEPAKAVGYSIAVLDLKNAIENYAESEKAKREQKLHELTFGLDLDAKSAS